MKRAGTGWPASGFKQKFADPNRRCLQGYAAKGRRVMARKGNHQGIGCPVELIEQARRSRDSDLAPIAL
jgi:hypothetical protein